MQAVGDGGQGWANALLFVILSKNNRQKLFIEPVKRVYRNIVNGVSRSKDQHRQGEADETKMLRSEWTTAPSSHPVYYPSYTYFSVPYTNAFTSVDTVSE